MQQLSPPGRPPLGTPSPAAPERWPNSDAGDTQRIVLGHIRLGRQLGSGVSSEVYAAENIAAGKSCAAKIFRAELKIGPVVRGRYLHQVQQLEQLAHRGLAGVYGFGDTPQGRFCTICDLIEGEPLRQLIRGQRDLASPRLYVPLMRQICEPLAVVHAYGLAHLRLHPGNVMIRWLADDAPEVRLLDFAVCQLHPPRNEPPPGLPLSAEDGICVAPEQAKGEVGDARSDVYAVAVLLYMMLTGRPPIVGDSYSATLERQLSEAPEPPGRWVAVSPEIEETVMRGLEKDPRRRMPSVEALISALDPLSASTGQHQLRARTHQAGRRLTTAEYRVIDAESVPLTPGATTRQSTRRTGMLAELRQSKGAKLLLGAAAAALLLFVASIALCTR